MGIVVGVSELLKVGGGVAVGKGGQSFIWP